MSNFTQFDGFVRRANHPTKYILLHKLSWRIGKATSDWQLECEAQTEFDISVPVYLRWVLSPHDKKVLPAACIHDELLKQGFDRQFAAAEFKRACKARGVSKIKTLFLFLAVLFKIGA